MINIIDIFFYIILEALAEKIKKVKKNLKDCIRKIFKIRIIKKKEINY